MTADPLHRSDLLEIEEHADEDSVALRFRGKSILREPAEFLAPLLIKSLATAGSEDKRLVLEFRGLLYMNSSTLTPLIKILERARTGKAQVTVLYLKDLKWQDISFSALDIFQTKDRRIEVRGV